MTSLFFPKSCPIIQVFFQLFKIYFPIFQVRQVNICPESCKRSQIYAGWIPVQSPLRRFTNLMTICIRYTITSITEKSVSLGQVVLMKRNWLIMKQELFLDDSACASHLCKDGKELSDRSQKDFTCRHLNLVKEGSACQPQSPINCESIR